VDKKWLRTLHLKENWFGLGWIGLVWFVFLWSGSLDCIMRNNVQNLTAIG